MNCDYCIHFRQKSCPLNQLKAKVEETSQVVSSGQCEKLEVDRRV